MKRTMLLSAAIAGAVALAGCGGSSSGGTPAGSAGPSASSAPSGAEAQITANWEAFFAPATPLQRSLQILQNGRKFESVLRGQAGTSRAAQATAKVTKVDLTAPTKATVTYTILLGGHPVLQGQQGTALKHNGIWQVSDQSFCALLTLEQQHPAACGSAP